MLYAGSLVFVKAGRASRSPEHRPLVAVHARRGLAPSARTGQLDRRKSSTIPSCTSRIATPKRSRGGKGRSCRPKPNGSLPRVAASMALTTRGATNSSRTIGTWPTRGRANFRGGTSASDGYDGTSPVGAFPPNGYGLYDMIGNVWEWTTDWYQPGIQTRRQGVLHPAQSTRGPTRTTATIRVSRRDRIPRKVLKGGSHLCAPNYCRRYRPAARFPEPIDTSTCHVGFRCIVRAARLRDDRRRDAVGVPRAVSASTGKDRRDRSLVR